MLASEESILNLKVKRSRSCNKGKELLLFFFCMIFGFWFEFSSVTVPLRRKFNREFWKRLRIKFLVYFFRFFSVCLAREILKLCRGGPWRRSGEMVTTRSITNASTQKTLSPTSTIDLKVIHLT